MGMIIGEPGIGKTVLLDMFVAQVRAIEQVWVGRGQCIEHSWSRGAVCPSWEALGRL